MECTSEIQLREKDQPSELRPGPWCPQVRFTAAAAAAQEQQQQQQLEKEKRNSTLKEVWMKQMEGEEGEEDEEKKGDMAWKEGQQHRSREHPKKQHKGLQPVKQRREDDEQEDDEMDEEGDTTGEFSTGSCARWSWSTNSSLGDSAATPTLQQWDQQGEKPRCQQHEVEQQQSENSRWQQIRSLGEKPGDVDEEQKHHQPQRKRERAQHQQHAAQQQVVEQSTQKLRRETGQVEDEKSDKVDEPEKIPENASEMHEGRWMKHEQQDVKAQQEWREEHAKGAEGPVEPQDEREKLDSLAQQQSKDWKGTSKPQTSETDLDTQNMFPDWCSSVPADNHNQASRPVPSSETRHAAKNTEKEKCCVNEETKQREEKTEEQRGEDKGKQKRQVQHVEPERLLCRDSTPRGITEAAITRICSAADAFAVANTVAKEDAASISSEEQQASLPSEKEEERRTENSNKLSAHVLRSCLVHVDNSSTISSSPNNSSTDSNTTRNRSGNSVNNSNTTSAFNGNFEEHTEGELDCAPLLHCLLSSKQHDSISKTRSVDDTISSNESTCSTEGNSSSPCSSTGSCSLSNSPSSLHSSILRAGGDTKRLILPSSSNSDGAVSDAVFANGNSSGSERLPEAPVKLSSFSADRGFVKSESNYAAENITSSNSGSKVLRGEGGAATDVAITGLELALQQLLVPLPSLEEAPDQLNAHKSSARGTAQGKEGEDAEDRLSRVKQPEQDRRRVLEKRRDQGQEQQQGGYEDKEEQKENMVNSLHHQQQESHEMCGSSSSNDLCASQSRKRLLAKEESATMPAGAAQTRAGIRVLEAKAAAGESEDGIGLRINYSKNSRDSSSIHSTSEDKCCLVRALQDEKEEEDKEAKLEQLHFSDTSVLSRGESTLKQGLHNIENVASLRRNNTDDSSELKRYSSASPTSAATTENRLDLDQPNLFFEPLMLAVAEAVAHVQGAWDEEEPSKEEKGDVLETAADDDHVRLFQTHHQKYNPAEDEEREEEEVEEGKVEKLNLRDILLRHYHKKKHKGLVAGEKKNGKDEGGGQGGLSEFAKDDDVELETLQRLLAEKLSRALPEETKYTDQPLSFAEEEQVGQQHVHCSWERGRDRESSDKAAATRGSSSSTCVDDDFEQQGLDVPLPAAAFVSRMWPLRPAVGDDVKTSAAAAAALRGPAAKETPAARRLGEQQQQSQLETLCAYHVPPLSYGSEIPEHESILPHQVAVAARAMAEGEVAQGAATEGGAGQRHHRVEADAAREKVFQLKGRHDYRYFSPEGASLDSWSRARREEADVSATLERCACDRVDRVGTEDADTVAPAGGVSAATSSGVKSMLAALLSAVTSAADAARGIASNSSYMQAAAAGGAGEEHPVQHQQQRSEGEVATAAMAALLQILLAAIGSREGADIMQLLRHLMEREQRQQGQQLFLDHNFSRNIITNEQRRSSVVESSTRATLRLQGGEEHSHQHPAGGSYPSGAIEGGAAAAEGRKAPRRGETLGVLRAESAGGVTRGLRAEDDDYCFERKCNSAGVIGPGEIGGTATKQVMSLHNHVEGSNGATMELLSRDKRERSSGNSSTLLDNVDENQDSGARRVFQRRLSIDDALLQQQLHLKQQQQRRPQLLAGEEEETGVRQLQQQGLSQQKEGHDLLAQQPRQRARQHQHLHDQETQQYNVLQQQHVLQPPQPPRLQHQQQLRDGEQLQHWHHERLKQEESQRQQLWLRQLLAKECHVSEARTSRQQPMTQREEEELLLIQQWMKRQEQQARAVEGDETHQERTCEQGEMCRLAPLHAPEAALPKKDQRIQSKTCKPMIAEIITDNPGTAATGSGRNYEQTSSSVERTTNMKEAEEANGLTSQQEALPHLTWEDSNSNSHKELLLSNSTSSTNSLVIEKQNGHTESIAQRENYQPSVFRSPQERASRQSGDACDAERAVDYAAVGSNLHHQAVHRGTAAAAVSETRSAVLQLQQQQKQKQQQETQQQEGKGKREEEEEEGRRRYYTRLHIGGRQQQEQLDQERWKSDGHILGRNRGADKSAGAVNSFCSLKRNGTSEAEGEDKGTEQHLDKTSSTNRDDYSLRAAVSRFSAAARPGILHSSTNRGDRNNIRPSTTRLTSGTVAAASTKEVVRGVYFDVTNQAWAANMRVKGRVQKKSFSLKRYGSEARQRAIQARKEMEKDFGKAPLLFFTGLPALPFAAALHPHHPSSSNYNTTHMRHHGHGGGSILQRHGGSSGGSRYLTNNHSHSNHNSHVTHSNIVKSVGATSSSYRYDVNVTDGRTVAPATTTGKNETIQPGSSSEALANNGEGSRGFPVSRHGDTYTSPTAVHRGYCNRNSDPEKDSTGVKEASGSTR